MSGKGRQKTIIFFIKYYLLSYTFYQILSYISKYYLQYYIVLKEETKIMYHLSPRNILLISFYNNG